MLAENVYFDQQNSRYNGDKRVIIFYTFLNRRFTIIWDHFVKLEHRIFPSRQAYHKLFSTEGLEIIDIFIHQLMLF